MASLYFMTLIGISAVPKHSGGQNLGLHIEFFDFRHFKHFTISISAPDNACFSKKCTVGVYCWK